MNNEEKFQCLWAGLRVFMGAIGGLLLIGFGLDLYALRIWGEAGFGEILSAFFMATWIGVLGVVGLALIPVLMLFRSKTRCRGNQGAKSLIHPELPKSGDEGPVTRSIRRKVA